MPASIFQINISNGGVPKLPIDSGVVTPLGLEGDVQAHPEIHGGPQQALLLITFEGLAELVAQGFPLYAGALGENITTIGLDRRDVRIGQQLQLGSEVLVEITKPRAPCNTLTPYGPGIQAAVYDAQVKAHDASSPRWGLAGFYVKVIQGGIIQPGDEIRLA